MKFLKGAPITIFSITVLFLITSSLQSFLIELEELSNFTASERTRQVAVGQCKDSTGNNRYYLVEGNWLDQNILYEIECGTGALTQLMQFSSGTRTRGVDFLTCTDQYGVEHLYLAEGNGSNGNNQQNVLYEINCGDSYNPMTVVPSGFPVKLNDTRSVHFFTCQDSIGNQVHYLFEVNNGTGNNNVQPNIIYRVDGETGSLTQTDQITLSEQDRSREIALLECFDTGGDRQYFVAEANRLDPNRIYRFNPDTGTVTSVLGQPGGFDAGANDQTWSVDFHTSTGEYGVNVFLAEGNQNSFNRIYRFDCDTGLLTSVTGMTGGFDPGDAYTPGDSRNTRAVRFHTCLDQCRKEHYYLIEGNNGQGNRLYRFDPTDGSLTDISTNLPATFTQNTSTRDIQFFICDDQYGAEQSFIIIGRHNLNRLYRSAILPVDLQIEVPCILPGDTAAVTFSVSGGSGVYDFLLDGQPIGDGPLLLSPTVTTTYTLTVQDYAGCFLDRSFTLPVLDCQNEPFIFTIRQLACEKEFDLISRLYREGLECERRCFCLTVDVDLLVRIFIPLLGQYENLIPADCICDRQDAVGAFASLIEAADDGQLQPVVDLIEQGGCCADLLLDVLLDLYKRCADIDRVCSLLNILQSSPLYGCSFCDVVTQWFWSLQNSAHVGQYGAAQLLTSLLEVKVDYAQALGQKIIDCLCQAGQYDFSGLISEVMVKADARGFNLPTL